MAESHNTTTDETAELNGTKLTDLDAAADALNYLTEGYNDGDLTFAEGGRCLIVTTRSTQFQHFSLFQRCENLRIGNVRAVANGPRLAVEIREADE